MFCEKIEVKPERWRGLSKLWAANLHYVVPVIAADLMHLAARVKAYKSVTDRDITSAFAEMRLTRTGCLSHYSILKHYQQTALILGELDLSLSLSRPAQNDSAPSLQGHTKCLGKRAQDNLRELCTSRSPSPAPNQAWPQSMPAVDVACCTNP